MVLCPKCGKENLPVSKFCDECGASLAPALPKSLLCPKCGSENLPTGKFCHQCGASLAPTIPPAQELPSAPPPAPKRRKHQKPASRAANVIMALVGVIVGIGLFIQLVHPFGLSLSLGTANQVEAHNKQGITLLNQGKFAEAIAEFTEVIKLDPTYVAAYSNRGNAYRSTGQFGPAMADYNRAISLNPSYANTYNGRGIAYYMQVQYDLAIADHSKAIELDPKNAIFYNNRGLDYRMKGQLDLALADYSKAVELDPKYAAAYNNRGVIYQNQKQYDLALADYDKAIELDPRHIYAWNNKGLTLENFGRLEEALQCFNKALELDASYQAAKDNRDRVMAKMRGGGGVDLAAANKTVADVAAAIQSKDAKAVTSLMSARMLADVKGDPDLSTPQAAALAEAMRNAKVLKAREDAVLYEMTLNGVRTSFMVVRENGAWKIYE